jgi:DNA-binding transcriptional LysR family regulator
MELRHLRYFAAAAEALNFSRAAKKLHVSQPALSRQIADLEDELGVELFKRERQRVTLSGGGRFFLPLARRILCDAETSVQQLRETHGGSERVLRIGFISTFADDFVAPAVRQLRKLHPRLKVSLFDLPPRSQLDRLRAHELDAALLGNLDERDRADFRVVRLGRYPMAAVVPADDALATRRSISVGDLRARDFISLSNSAFPGRRDFLRGICQPHGFEPRITLETDSLQLLLAAVAAGEGVALLPRHAEKLPHSGCTFIALKKPVPQAEAYLLRSLEENPLAAEFEQIVAKGTVYGG